jgi:four helix bundle protein
MFLILMNKNSKSESLNSKQITNHKNPNSKIYNLEDRTLQFAKRINKYVNKLPKTIPNMVNGRQLVRSGGSVGSNYIEANESLSKKDFKMRVKISKKESKETRYWLKLTEPKEKESVEKNILIQESTELMKIFGSILEKTKE